MSGLMKLRVGVALTASLLAGIGLGPSGRVHGSSAVTVLQATPFQGHMGDPIDLSGSGFQPGQELVIFMACPNWLDKRVYVYHNYVRLTGLTTNNQGEFAGFLFRGPTLDHIIPPIGCQIYLSNPAAQEVFVPGVVPATYTILAAKSHLLRCQRSMCVSNIILTPRRVRPRHKERIEVRGWPGAQVDVTLSYPTHDKHFVQRLDWRGRNAFTETVPETSAQQTSVRISVRARLGTMTDTRSGTFTITR